MLYENKLEWLKSCMDYHQPMSKKGTSGITNYNSDWVFIPNIVSPPSKIQKLYYLQFSPKEVLLWIFISQVCPFLLEAYIAELNIIIIKNILFLYKINKTFATFQ